MLKHRFDYTSMSSGQDLGVSLTRLHLHAVHELELMGEVVSEQLIVAIVLEGSPKEYEVVKSNPLGNPNYMLSKLEYTTRTASVCQ